MFKRDERKRKEQENMRAFKERSNRMEREILSTTVLLFGLALGFSVGAVWQFIKDDPFNLEQNQFVFMLFIFFWAFIFLFFKVMFTFSNAFSDKD